MCLFESSYYDDIAIRNAADAKDITLNLSINNVVMFLESLGVEDIDIQSDYLVCPTICHNPLDEAESMKLYYYDKTKNFHCYTECSENFSIIELYRRYMDINHYAVDYWEAVEYIRQFLTDTDIDIHTNKKEVIKNEKTEKIDFINLPAYNNHVMDCFVEYNHPLWLRENISPEAMRQFDIKFSISQNKIIIPHYDINGKLVGIRARAIEKEDVERGKYMPILVGDKLYNHQLGFNLYGINENKKAIQLTKRAIIFEAEKSVLLSNSYFDDFSTAVATCGSQLNRFQINLLTKKLGVNEITLAFDKEYEEPFSEKGRIYRQKLIDKCKKYQGLATFYYIFDEHGLLKEKDSPIDRGLETFNKLFSKRIKIV